MISKTRWNESTVQFFGIASYWRMRQKNSFHLLILCIQTPEAEFLFTAMFHPSAPQEVVFLRVKVFHPFYSFFADLIVEIAPISMIFAHIGNYLI